ncbi:DUF5605 domain-containing protein [Microbacterium tumbae]
MFDSSSTFGTILDHPVGRSVLVKHLPGIAASPMARQYAQAPVAQIVDLVPELAADAERRDRLWRDLADVSSRIAPHGVRRDPDPQYEGEDVPRASAAVAVAEPTPLWRPLEVRLHGPSHGNPFVDVELTAVFCQGETELRVGGFYDGDGRYVLRALPDREGEWSFETRSTARSLDGIRGAVTVTAAEAGSHGPVRVDGFHFRHADGTRHRPLGTTAYAWIHQSERQQELTLASLAASGFRKVRMCLFPKSYLFNANEPEQFAFVTSPGGGFDHERFDVAFFQRLERRIAQLEEIGVQADIILFHAYDRWGFSDLGPAVDERYVRYAVRRLAALPNVWWSLANEFDLIGSKTVQDWERLAALLSEEDHVRHPASIHNCVELYDHSAPWVSHVSIQRTDVYRTAENTDAWRERWGKPVVVDECGYEGDIDQGWGNLTAEELTRRFWEAAVRGGYLGHGETYLNAEDDLWWSKGGVLRGSSPERIAFLDRILGEAPEGAIDPLPSDWDLPWGGSEGWRLAYFGFNRPRFRNVLLPEGTWIIEVIDTWNMTVERIEGRHSGLVKVELPGRQYMALRCRLIGDED